MPPLVSIITVTKNCVATIERTLESVQAIKTPDIQYIIVDGGSTDGTLLKIAEYGDLVDILVSEADSGIYNAMNKGTLAAQGKYVLFLNGDDYILGDGFRQAKSLLEREAPEILSCRSEVVDSDGGKGARLQPSLWRLYFFNTIPHLSTFVSAELQKKYKFRERFRIAADYDLFLRMFVAGHKFMLSELVTAVHHRGGFSSNARQSLDEIRQIRKNNLSFMLYFASRGIELLNTVKNFLCCKTSKNIS